MAGHPCPRARHSPCPSARYQTRRPKALAPRSDWCCFVSRLCPAAPPQRCPRLPPRGPLGARALHLPHRPPRAHAERHHHHHARHVISGNFNDRVSSPLPDGAHGGPSSKAEAQPPRPARPAPVAGGPADPGARAGRPRLLWHLGPGRRHTLHINNTGGGGRGRGRWHRRGRIAFQFRCDRCRPGAPGKGAPGLEVCWGDRRDPGNPLGPETGEDREPRALPSSPGVAGAGRRGAALTREKIKDS